MGFRGFLKVEKDVGERKLEFSEGELRNKFCSCLKEGRGLVIKFGRRRRFLEGLLLL